MFWRRVRVFLNHFSLGKTYFVVGLAGLGWRFHAPELALRSQKEFPDAAERTVDGNLRTPKKPGGLFEPVEQKQDMIA